MQWHMQCNVMQKTYDLQAKTLNYSSITIVSYMKIFKVRKSSLTTIKQVKSNQTKTFH